MRRWMLIPLIGLLAIGVAGSAGAATLDFTGTLQLDIMGRRDVAGNPIYLTVPGAGSAQVTDDGNLHLLSFTLPGGTFGPSTVTRTVIPTFGTLVDSFRFTLAQNLNGGFSGISGGPPGGGPMGLAGTAKICLCFWGHLACNAYIPLPLTPTGGGAGFGLGGTRTATGPYSINATLQNAPWTIGQPTMTLHTPNSTITMPVLPGGFAHGPASLTSSTAQPSGVVQLVTVSKVYTNFVFREFPLTGILNLHFVPEPGTLLLLGFGVAALAAAGRRRSLH